MLTNNYSLEDFDNPDDKKKARIGATIFFILVIILIGFKWFSTEYPIPEAEGLMASFGNVEIAGGGVENPTDEVSEEKPQEEVVEQTVDKVEDIEEVETVDDPSDITVKSTDKPTKTTSKNTNQNTSTPPKKQVNNNAMFGGGGGGIGTGTGVGKQGTPDGKGNLGGTGRGQKGNGKGAIGNRENIKQCQDYKLGKTNSNESGKVTFRICVNANGDVISADLIRKKSTLTSSSLIKLAQGCAKSHKYKKKPGAPDACGELVIKLGLE